MSKMRKNQSKMWLLYLNALHYIGKNFPIQRDDRKHSDFVKELNSLRIIKLNGFKYDVYVREPAFAYLPHISKYPLICFQLCCAPLMIVHTFEFDKYYFAANLLKSTEEEPEITIFVASQVCPFCGDKLDSWDFCDLECTPECYRVRHFCEFREFSLDFCQLITFWVDATKTTPSSLYAIARHLYYYGKNVLEAST